MGTSATSSPPPDHPMAYRFFDVALSLSATRPPVLGQFDAAHRAFRERGRPQDGPRVECLVDTDDLGQGSLIINGEHWPLVMSDPDSAYAFSLIMDAVAAASQTHLFLHASAIRLGTRTALFTGPSGCGKTTLAQALVSRGAVLLADDMAPIDLASGALAPFVRGSLPGETAPPPAPSAADCVFLLRPSFEPVRLHFAIDRLPPEWQETPPWHPRGRVSVRSCQGYYEVRAESGRPRDVETFRQACERAQVVMLRELGTPRAQFGPTPSLTEIAPAAALPWLVADLFGRRGRDITQLIAALSVALRAAGLWRLAPGSPDQTADAVARLLGNPGLARKT